MTLEVFLIGLWSLGCVFLANQIMQGREVRTAKR